ncbi:MAG TPA: SCO1664 family protein [Actinomycetota bacterium]|nr:SCO1664 family protein [Actinomycetota bacterium]
MSQAPSAEDADLELLAAGRLDVLGRLPRASNATLLARVERGGREALAVYKPRAGERPLWDFPDGTLCVREVAAYLVARTLGWPSVPPTVLRDGPLGVGSVQRFVEHDPAEHALSLVERFPEEFRRIAAFDVVVNNADRKAGHCLLGTDGRVHVVDHGVCFAEPPKLRTVLWDFVGEPLPPAIVPDLERLAEEVRGGELGSRLASLLSPEEAAAVGRRAERLARAATFPGPGAERPYPWPLL